MNRLSADEQAKLWTALLNSSGWLYDIEEETSSVELEEELSQLSS
jgi:hypothetical protein